MAKGLFRLWFVVVFVWLAYTVYTRWEHIVRVERHDWEAAIGYGVNKYLYCEFPTKFECKPGNWIPNQQDFLIEQDFQLILTAAVYPLALAVILFIVGWVLSGFFRKSR
ncbi:MAG TPA: hypothetical protein ENK63_04375 [Rhodobacterales bacterium]|nr:hypothetical protein [Rhodobacterales bacterium]